MFLRAVASAARSLELPGQRILVAVSGGVDSTALLVALHDLAPELDLEICVGHVDHGLRSVAAEDAAFVGQLARELGHALRVAHIDPRGGRSGRASRDRPTIQESARRLRYAALREMARELGARHVATGHHADDQAETVLLRLLRGASPEGLGGIPERSPDGVVVRPLLRLSRAAIRAFAEDRGLRWREDESNRDERYARNRLRARWISGLAAEFNPRLLRAIGDLAEAQRRESEWINAQVEKEARRCFERRGPDVLWIEPRGWPERPEALARRLVRRALRSCGAARDVSRVHVDRVLRFLREGRSGTRIELPGGRLLARERDGYWLLPAGCRSPSRAKLQAGQGNFADRAVSEESS